MEANKETLEETLQGKGYHDYWVDGCIAGAKWQSERMYSEEKLKEAFRQGQDNMEYSEMFGWDSKLTEQQWFEQFKKK